MPTVITGTNSGLQLSIEKIVMNLVKYRFPQEAIGDLPSQSQILWSLLGYLGYGDYQVSFEPASAALITPLSIGQDRIERYQDPLIIHLWVRKNIDTIPDSIHSITQKIEEIIKENVTNVGYGITSIIITSPFSQLEEREFFSRGFGGGIQTSMQNATEISLWHTQCSVQLDYFLATIHIDGVSSTKMHKYNVIGKVQALKTHKFDILV